MKSTRVLVTGGLGFIGGSVAAHLTRMGCVVTVLDIRRRGQVPSYLEDVESSIQWCVGDVTDWETVSTVAARQDAIIHLADPPSFMMYEESPKTSTVATVAAFLNVLEAARAHRIGRVVYASTSTVYKGNPPPFREEMALVPIDLKSLSKKWKEELALLYSNRYKSIVAVGFRPFTLYGPGEESKGGFASVVSLFAWAMLNGGRPIVWGDGTQTRDYVYIEDAARLFGLALEDGLESCVLNLGTGTSFSFNDIVMHINSELGSCLEPQYVPAASPAYAWHMCADVGRLRSTLGFVPDTPLDEGIRRTVGFFKASAASVSSLSNAQLLFRDKLGDAG